MVSIAACIITVIGTLITVASFLFAILYLPDIIEDRVLESVKLIEGTEAFERWETTPLPVDFKVHFFHVLNVEDVQHGETPVVKEVGPYVYKQYRRKINITREDDILSYYQRQHYEFDAEASYPLTDTDEITILNLPLMSILLTTERLHGSGSTELFVLNTVIRYLFNEPTSIFLTTTPRDFLFDGIYINCNDTRYLQKRVCDEIGANAPPTLPRLEDGRFRFSLLGHKNTSHDGRYSLNSGIHDARALGEIVTWENSDTLSTWLENSTCNNIIGTDGSVFPPYRTEESVINVFSTDICRSMRLEYNTTTTLAGIKGLRYAVVDTALASPRNNPENECFCLNQTLGITGDDGCLLDGALELLNCQGAPVVLSFPHFYDADEAYQNGVIGLNPVESKHRMFLDLEPTSGTLLRGNTRVQFNMFSKPISRIKLTENLNTTLMPIVWISEGIVLNGELIGVLNRTLFDVLTLVSTIEWVVIIAGMLLFTGGVIWLLLSIVQNKKKA
ncbi:sensory neuron membrane protein 2-like [Athalia rosae]|uniref:sensory neuron membrane protein 2-like n=1 Tax=Athalia rosae TaxID=37344 RepID=UPI00203461F7|nr:sensory neuron membrane protein 2-like [Athalia rosae]